MTHRRILSEGSRLLGIPLTDDQIDAFLVYLVELDKWNRTINLTAIRNEQEIIIKHFLDSLSYLKGFTPTPGLRLLDIGSGAGFPGLPVKIAHPELAVTLVDSVKKKATFLRHMVRTLRLDGVDVIDTRFHELADAHHGSYDIVTARAFAGMDAALSAGHPFLKQSGRIILSRGPEEFIEDQSARDLGSSMVEKIELTLPHSDYRRTIWVFGKSGHSGERDRDVPRGTSDSV